MLSILHVGGKVKEISDNRERKSRYSIHASVMGALIGLLVQVESFNEMLGDPTRLSRIQKALGCKRQDPLSRNSFASRLQLFLESKLYKRRILVRACVLMKK